MQSLRWNNEFCVSLGWSGMKNAFVTLYNTQEVTLSVRCMNPFKDTYKYIQEYSNFLQQGIVHLLDPN